MDHLLRTDVRLVRDVPQGISLIQYPVEYQWIRYAYIGAVVAIGDLTLLMTHGFRVDSLRAAAGKPSNSWVFRLLYWMAAFGFVGFLGNHSLGILLTSGTAMFVAWYLSKKFKKYDDVTVGSIIYAIWLLLLPPIFLAIGAYVVAHHIEWIAGLGAFAVVGIGLILLAANTPPLRKRSSIFAPRSAKGFPTGPTSRVNHIPPKCR